MNNICELPTPWLDLLAGYKSPKSSTASRPSNVLTMFPVTDDLSAGVDLGFELPEMVTDGLGRESTILKYAGKLRAGGMSQELIERAVLDFNRLHINPPLDEETVLDRARRYAAQEPEQVFTKLAAKDGFVVFSDTPPPSRSYVIQDLLVSGKSYVLAGLGGVSKTMLAMQASIAVATGAQFIGKNTMGGGVLMVLGEEDRDEIGRRLGAISMACNLSKADKDIAQKRIRAFPMLGLDARLTAIKGGSLEQTGFETEIIAACKQLESESGSPVRLVVLDHAGLLHGGGFNDREHVVQTMRIVNYIADQTKAAVLVLAHSPKTATAEKQAGSEDVAGSTAWVDLARGAFVLRAMAEADAKTYGISSDERKAYVSLSVVKNNYGPSGDIEWLYKEVIPGWGVSVLTTVSLSKPIKTSTNTALQKRILETVLKLKGLSVNKLRDTYSGKDGPLKASRKEVEFALDQLLDDGRLIQVEPTPDERKNLNIPRQTVFVLRLP